MLVCLGGDSSEDDVPVSKLVTKKQSEKSFGKKVPLKQKKASKMDQGGKNTMDKVKVFFIQYYVVNI